MEILVILDVKDQQLSTTHVTNSHAHTTHHGVHGELVQQHAEVVNDLVTGLVSTDRPESSAVRNKTLKLMTVMNSHVHSGLNGVFGVDVQLDVMVDYKDAAERVSMVTLELLDATKVQLLKHVLVTPTIVSIGHSGALGVHVVKPVEEEIELEVEHVSTENLVTKIVKEVSSTLNLVKKGIVPSGKHGVNGVAVRPPVETVDVLVFVYVITECLVMKVVKEEIMKSISANLALVPYGLLSATGPHVQ